MAMPTLDPARFKRAWLVDPTHRLPMPKSARLFSPARGADGGEIVDTHDLYWRLPLADGSLTLRQQDAPPEPPEALEAPADEAPEALAPIDEGDAEN
jgi:hypothetical protein